jgi:hypothetical protein
VYRRGAFFSEKAGRKNGRPKLSHLDRSIVIALSTNAPTSNWCLQLWRVGSRSLMMLHLLFAGDSGTGIRLSPVVGWTEMIGEPPHEG